MPEDLYGVSHQDVGAEPSSPVAFCPRESSHPKGQLWSRPLAAVGTGPRRTSGEARSVRQVAPGIRVSLPPSCFMGHLASHVLWFLCATDAQCLWMSGALGHGPAKRRSAPPSRLQELPRERGSPVAAHHLAVAPSPTPTPRVASAQYPGSRVWVRSPGCPLRTQKEEDQGGVS